LTGTAEEERMKRDRKAQLMARVRGVGLVHKGRFFVRCVDATYLIFIADKDQVKKKTNQFIINLPIVGMFLSNHVIIIWDNIECQEFYLHINVSFQF
jgi:hypothetical protein